MTGADPVDDVAPFLWVDDVPASADRTLPSPRHDDTPGEAGLWVFVLGDLTIFSLFFLVLLAERRVDHARVADAARHLVLPLGLFNTLVLLTSSVVVVLATDAHRGGNLRRCRRLLGAAMALAGLFVAVKITEYGIELGGGQVTASHPFFLLYFVLTGLHLVHVVVGTTLLARWRTLAGRAWPGVRRFAEGSAVYWHMVDLLWVLIVSLVYLVARH